jgi:DNA-binding XRE family transcriptional regulator
MPKVAKPIVAKPPARRDPSVPLAVWETPFRLVRANQRLAVPYTQQTLAAASGVSQATISSVLAFKRLLTIRLDTALKLAHAMRVPLDWLLLGKGDEVPVADQGPQK